MRKNKLLKLIEKMKIGDVSAFEELYMEFKEPLYYIALELTKNDADAKDAVQETFIQIRHSISKLKEPKVFVLWMKRILLSKCYDIFRSNKHVVFNNEMTEDLLDNLDRNVDKTVEEFHTHSDQEIIRHLLINLTYVQQEVIALYYMDQMKIREIADVLRISEGTVKSRLNAGKVALRQQVEQYERMYGEKVNFHAKSIGAILAGYYAMKLGKGTMGIVSFVKSKTHAVFAQSPSLVIGTGVLVTSATALFVAPYISSLIEEPLQALPNHAIKQGLSDQDAYFQLRQWAHCEDEMKQKSMAEFAQIYAYYEQLQTHGGRYFEALKEDSWAQNFIEIKNSF